jgi:hypothetical protein
MISFDYEPNVDNFRNTVKVENADRLAAMDAPDLKNYKDWDFLKETRNRWTSFTLTSRALWRLRKTLPLLKLIKRHGPDFKLECLLFE